ncbi:flagellar biosynthesis protein FlhB [Lysinimonas soli]|uniref:Flagellar biosynthesis protein FlhB n=1 Tax=Lysinimonas soli TaxID=1074233 RepID=A0ABW0NSM2_9MICO
MAESQERTEQATEKRMKEVRRKGELSTSKDLSAWLSVAAAAASIPALAAAVQASTRNQFALVVEVIHRPTPQGAVHALTAGLGGIIPALAPMFVAVVAAVIAGAALQGGLHVKAFSLSFKHFDPIAGLKRVFGTHALWEGAKALLKTLVVGLVLLTVIQNVVPQLVGSGFLPLDQLVGVAQSSASVLIEAAVAAGLVVAAADVAVVMRRNLKRTRMSKREVKDENKSSEGDPLIKGMRRARAFAMSRRRMMDAVRTADVVVLNPTHIAVALRYEPGKSAPRVVAKGADEVAARIRENAAEHCVPMVHDIPLARTLHANCDIGDEIPQELYSAVAQVLAFVFALKSRGAGQGVHKLTTSTVLV